jgi:hypothetical protein
MSDLFIAILKWFWYHGGSTFQLELFGVRSELPHLAVKYLFHSARANGIVC